MAKLGPLLLTVLATVFMFGILIFIHELGHFLTARLFGVTVHEFSIGMGPKLFQKHSKKTGIDYSLRALPIGGYVAMEGEDEESNDPNAFGNKKVWQRMIVTAAGGAMNLILGLVLTAVFVLTMPGHFGTTVTAFPEMAVSCRGESTIAVGDEIVKINGSSVATGQEVVYELFRAGGNVKDRAPYEEEGSKITEIVYVDMTVIRDGEKVKLEDVRIPVFTENGITYGMRDFYYNEEAKTLGSTVKNIGRQMRLSVKMVYESLFDLIRGKYGFDQLSGPVGTAGAVGDAIKQDIGAGEGESKNSFVYLFMLISVNLGLFNLLPIPALDGGRLFFQLVELIVGKPIPAKYEGAIHAVGLVLLLGLMAVVTVKDVFGLFR